MHASSLKIAYCCIYAVTTVTTDDTHRRMLTWGFSRRWFPQLRLGFGAPATQSMKVGLEKNKSHWAASWCKAHDPTVISFESIPACDRQTDTPPVSMLRSTIAQRDKMKPTLLL